MMLLFQIAFLILIVQAIDKTAQAATRENETFLKKCLGVYAVISLIFGIIIHDKTWTLLIPIAISSIMGNVYTIKNTKFTSLIPVLAIITSVIIKFVANVDISQTLPVILISLSLLARESTLTLLFLMVGFYGNILIAGINNNHTGTPIVTVNSVCSVVLISLFLYRLEKNESS